MAVSELSGWVCSSGTGDLQFFPWVILPNIFFLLFSGGGRFLKQGGELTIELSTDTSVVDLEEGTGEVTSEDSDGDDASLAVSQWTMKAMILRKAISVQYID